MNCGVKALSGGNVLMDGETVAGMAPGGVFVVNSVGAIAIVDIEGRAEQPINNEQNKNNDNNFDFMNIFPL